MCEFVSVCFLCVCCLFSYLAELISTRSYTCCFFLDSLHARKRNRMTRSTYATKMATFEAAVLTHTSQSHPANKASDSSTVGIAINTAPNLPP